MLLQACLSKCGFPGEEGTASFLGIHKLKIAETKPNTAVRKTVYK
jgi:hypothetical protein